MSPHHALSETAGATAPQAACDGWLGTRELPGYRAGNVVARLGELPAAGGEHLHFFLLLLGADGQLQDLHSGPCPSMHRQQSIDERSRYVRVVAELVRHAPSDDRGLSAIGQALSFVRERGIQGDRLQLAAQLLDEASSEDAVVANLVHLLTLSLGADEARREIDQVLLQLEGSAARPADPPAHPAGLDAQVARVVQLLGKAKARRFLRDKIDLALVPAPDLLGV